MLPSILPPGYLWDDVNMQFQIVTPFDDILNRRNGKTITDASRVS